MRETHHPPSARALWHYLPVDSVFEPVGALVLDNKPVSPSAHKVLSERPRAVLQCNDGALVQHDSARLSDGVLVAGAGVPLFVVIETAKPIRLRMQAFHQTGSQDARP